MIVIRVEKLLAANGATQRFVWLAMADGTLGGNVPGTMKRPNTLRKPEVRDGRDASSVVLHLNLKMAITMHSADAVLNFALFVERNPRDANAHGSTLISPTLITKRKR
jgi:hypothetical protein